MKSGCQFNSLMCCFYMYFDSECICLKMGYMAIYEIAKEKKRERTIKQKQCKFHMYPIPMHYQIDVVWHMENKIPDKKTT